MKRPLYIIFNIIYQIIICWLLIILNAYYNEFLLEKLTGISDNLLMKILISIFECIILLAIVNIINRAVLSDTADKANRAMIANRTSVVQLIISGCLIIGMVLN